MDVLIVLLFLSPFLLLILAVLALPVYATIAGFHRRKTTKEHLAQAEPALAHLTQATIEAPAHVGPVGLVSGSVVYAADQPSRFAAGFRQLVGGKFESLTEQADLARRLAVVRMLAEAQQHGATAVTNVRIETSEIVEPGQRQQAIQIEILAYGTALYPAAARQAA